MVTPTLSLLSLLVERFVNLKKRRLLLTSLASTVQLCRQALYQTTLDNDIMEVSGQRRQATHSGHIGCVTVLYRQGCGVLFLWDSRLRLYDLLCDITDCVLKGDLTEIF